MQDLQRSWLQKKHKAKLVLHVALTIVISDHDDTVQMTHKAKLAWL